MSQYPEQYGQYSQQAPYNQQAQGYQGYGQAPNTVPASKDDRNMSVVAHLSSAVLALLSFATLSIIAPLIMWFIYKDKPGYGFTKEAARRAFNFNFSLWVSSAASWLLIVLTFGILGIILWVVPLVVTILMIIFHSLAALAAHRGEQYTYPMTFIELIK